MVDREQFKQILMTALAAAAVGATVLKHADAQAAEQQSSTSANGLFADGEEYREIFRQFIEAPGNFTQFLENFFEVVEPPPPLAPDFPELPDFPDFPGLPDSPGFP